MPLRILSGIIYVPDNAPKVGQVTIGFDPHELVSGSSNVQLTELQEVGPAGRFRAIPVKSVSMRQIVFGTQDFPGSSGFTKFRLKDAVTRDNLVVDYEGVRFAFFEEISYMIIGEVP